MTDTLTVETGAGVADADSYITLAAARIFAATRGLTISATDDTACVQLRNAVDYLEAQRSRYQGEKVSATQALQWPRKCVYLDDAQEQFAVDAIPALITQAQVRLAAIIHSGVDLMPTVSGSFVKFEKIGPIESAYSETVGTSGSPLLKSVDALLAPLYTNPSGNMQTVRV